MRKMGGPDEPGHDDQGRPQPQRNHSMTALIRAGPKPALVSARPRACFSFVGVELRNRLWRRRDKPHPIAKKRERQSHCLGSLANMRFPSERGTSKRDEN